MKTASDKIGKRAIIIDTSAIVAGFDPFTIKEEQYTTPKVREETTEDTMPGQRFRTAIENGRVTVKNPQKTFLERAKAFASSMGDSFFLSETDLQVLALALELKTEGYSPLIATDDYSIQNVATEMKFEFAPLTTFGIRRRLQWMRYCPACHKKYPANYKSRDCQICGTALKRKPLKKG
ncbi:MAG: hypothetical protein ABSB89_02925 [Candidatus Bathyarchaeia archaeon]